MTFKEKLQMEHPENIDEVWCGGCRNCPSTYGYEKKRNCDECGEEKCAECWNREIPNTEPKAEIDAADYINIYTEGHGKGYTEGLNDASEFVRKLYDMKCDELEKIFDVDGGFWSVIRDFTLQEAFAKLKAYEDSKIEVGDVVKLNGTNYTYVVTVIQEESDGTYYCGLSKNGRWFAQNNVKKTDKHIDIKSFLEQIGE